MKESAPKEIIKDIEQALQWSEHYSTRAASALKEFGVSEEEIEKAKNDSLKSLKAGFKSKDNSPDEDTARANIFVAFVLCIVGFCVLMLITLFLVVRRHDKNDTRIKAIRKKAEKMTFFVSNVLTDSWPEWAKKEYQKIGETYSVKFRNKFARDIWDLPKFSFGTVLYSRKRISALEADLLDYELCFIRIMKISNDIGLFSARAPKSLIEVQKEIETMGDTLIMMENDGFGVFGFKNRLIALRGRFKNIPTQSGKHRESFIDAYKIHLAILTIKSEIDIEKKAKESFAEQLSAIESHESSIDALISSFQEDYKKWINKYPNKILETIGTLKGIEIVVNDSRRKVIEGKDIITSNRDDKYTYALSCFQQARILLKDAEERIQRGRDVEQRIDSIKKGYTKRYAEVNILREEVNSFLFNSDFRLMPIKGTIVLSWISVSEIDRLIERIVDQTKQPKIDWLLIDSLLNNVKEATGIFLGSQDKGMKECIRRHGVDPVSSEIKNHNPFNGFGA